MSTDQVAESHGHPDITEVLSTVTDLEERARTFVRQRPVVAVLAAVGAGYLVARLLSWRRA